MLTVTVCLAILILKAAARDFNHYDYQEIRHKAFSGNNMVYTVLKGKPLRIILENYNARYVRCGYFKTQFKFVEFIETVNVNNRIVAKNIKNVTDEMSTSWMCNVLRNYNGGIPYPYQGHNYTFESVYFDVHVKGIENVRFYLNNEFYMKPVRTNILTEEYDGRTIYNYVDGEVIQLSCSKEFGVAGSYHLNYYDARGYPLIQTFYEFQLYMTLKNNNSYVDCVLTAENSADVYKYRTTFIMYKQDIKDEQQPIVMSVNGFKLVLKIHEHNSKYNINNYKYIEGEVLNITCQKRNKHMKGSLGIFAYDIADDGTYNGYWLNRENKDELTETIKVSLNTSQRTIGDINCKISNDEVQVPYATIQFSINYRDQERPRLLGLKLNNVEYEYRYYNQFTIGYQATVNEILNLTCILKPKHVPKFETHKLEWKFGDTIDFSHKYDVHSDYIQDTRSFVIEDKPKISTIKCVSHRVHVITGTIQKLEVILKLKPQLSSDTDNDKVSNLNPQQKSARRDFLAVAASNAESMRMVTAATQLQAEAAIMQAETSLLFEQASNKIGDAIVSFANKNDL